MTKLIRVPQMLSARTVAKRLKKSRAWVYEQCESGAFTGAFKDRHYWKIPEPSVLAYLDAMVAMTRERR